MAGEMRRMLTGRGFLIGLALAVAALIFGIRFPDQEALEELLSPGTFFTLVQGALCSREVAFLFPIAAVLPWSISFLEESKCGFLKASLPRSGRRGYVERKTLAVLSSGALAWALAAVSVTAVMFVIFFPREQTGKVGAEQMLAFFLLVGRASLLGSVISLWGGICGAITESIYLAWGFPFVFWYFGIILKERYMPDAFWLYPPEWIRGEVSWGEQKLGLWLFLFLFLLISTLVFAGVIRAKVNEV